MKCPNDGATLVMSERTGIEIDYCPDCRGVWLDRGELDKIIDRAGATGTAAPAAATPPAPPQPQPYVQPDYVQPGYGQQGYGQQYGSGDRRSGGQQGYYRKKKDNWLSELFD